MIVVSVFLFVGDAFAAFRSDDIHEVHAVSSPGVTLAIAQTIDGYIWFGTSNGLFRHDGQKVIRVPLSAADGPVRVLLPRKEGGLWAATGGGYLDLPQKQGDPYSIALREGNGGLSLVVGLNSKTILAADGSPGAWVWSLAENPLGGLWVGTEAGLLRCRSETHECVATSGVPSGPIAALLSEGSGDLWIGRSDGLWRLSSSSAERVQSLPHPIRALARQSATEFWTLGDQSLTLLKDARVKATYLADDKYNLRTLVPGKVQSEVLVGTTRGLLKVDATGFLPSEIVVPQQSIRSIVKDREGSIWLASKGSGVLQIRVAAVRNWGPIEGLGGVPLALLRETSGAILVNTNLGLVRWDHNRFDLLTMPATATPWKTRHLAQSQSGDIWMAWDELLRYHPTSLTTDAHSFSQNGGVRAAHVDTQGDLWLGWRNGGVSQYSSTDTQLRSGRNYSSQNGLCTGAISNIVSALGATGTDLWIASSGGLARWRDGAGTCLYPSAPGSLGQITGIVEQPKGSVWLTTVGRTGLWMAAEGKLTPLRAVQPFPGTSLYGVASDGGPYLWFSSARGVFRVETSSLVGGSSGEPIQHIYQADESTGMRSADGQSTYHPNIISNGRGGVLVSTALGISEILSPESLPTPTMNAVIDDVQIGGAVFPVRDDMTIPPHNKDLEIRFSMPTFLARSPPHISHQLEGWDREFIDDRDVRVVRYAALPPGQYRFRLRAKSADSLGTPVASERLWRFVVAPDWYQRGYMQIAMVIVFILLLTASHRGRTARIRRGFNATQTERNRIARELHDGLAQFFVGLGLQLEALRTYRRMSPEKGDHLISQLKEMARDAQAESKNVIWGLRSSITAQSVTTAIESTVVSARQKLGIQITSRYRGIVPQSRILQDELAQITREALTNAVHRGGASATHVELSVTNEGIRLTIDDNGIGVTDATDTARVGGLGLVGIRERAARCGGIVLLESRVHGGARLTVKIKPIS
jgi:ligand-binding sensor domain-containing protein/signal transduction histidine kinase